MSLLRLVGMLGVVCLLGGCGMVGGDRNDDAGSGGGGRVFKGNMQEAADQADQILDETLAGVHPEVTWTHGETVTGACTNAAGGSTDKGTVTRRRAVMTVISEQRRGSFLGVVERHWKKSGYRVLSVNSSKKHPAIYVETPKGFRVRLLLGYKGQAFFKITTPCADRSHVSRPGTKPNGPDYSGRQIPAPDVHSDFWSADSAASSGG